MDMPILTHSSKNKPADRTRPVPGEDDVDRAMRLRAEGRTVVEVGKAINTSPRSVYRLLATGRERVELRDTEAWSLMTSVDDGATPEAMRYLLETSESVRWRRGAARYAWVLHQLKPELPPELVSAFAEMQVNVSRRSGRDREMWARILDLALVTEPWSGQENEDRFFEDLHARNESDLEFAAQVFNYLKGIASNWTGIFHVAGPVPDQVGWLRARVDEIEREETGDPGTVQLIESPGNGEPKKGKS